MVGCSGGEYVDASKNEKENYHITVLVVPHQGIYLKGLKLGPPRDVCTPMCLALLFIIVKIWKKPKCP